MFNFYTFWYFLFLVSGSLLALSAASWPGMWVGLEVNMLSFLMLMIGGEETSSYSLEGSSKYFLVQAFASMLLMLFFVMGTSTFTLPFILLKLGFAPLHSWMMDVIQSTSWYLSLTLLTWQKLAPFSILFFVISPWILALSGIASVLVALLAVPQLIAHKILAISSIFHLCWMAPLTFNMQAFYLYFLVYSASLSLVFLLLGNLNTRLLGSLARNISEFKLMSLMVLTLMGLPPFSVFIVKWISLLWMISCRTFLLPYVLVCSSLLLILVYSRLAFYSLSLSHLEWCPSRKPRRKIEMFLFLGMALGALPLTLL